MGLRPKWIALLVLALAIATAFVFLSQWQLSRSAERQAPPISQSEQIKPFTQVLKPGEVLTASQADQMVWVSGTFSGQQVIIQDRTHGEELGSWVVESLAVSDPERQEAEQPTQLLVVRGWLASGEPPPAALKGRVELTGRLLPSEPPQVVKDDTAPRAVLSAAELSNIWDVRLYSAFLASTTVAPPEPPAQPEQIMEEDFRGGLLEVSVGPQPEGGLNWLNLFYAVEWVFLAGFAIFLWWRLVADEYNREQSELYDQDPRYLIHKDANQSDANLSDANQSDANHQDTEHEQRII